MSNWRESFPGGDQHLVLFWIKTIVSINCWQCLSIIFIIYRIMRLDLFTVHLVHGDLDLWLTSTAWDIYEIVLSLHLWYKIIQIVGKLNNNKKVLDEVELIIPRNQILCALNWWHNICLIRAKFSRSHHLMLWMNEWNWHQIFKFLVGE